MYIERSNVLKEAADYVTLYMVTLVDVDDEKRDAEYKKWLDDVLPKLQDII